MAERVRNEFSLHDEEKPDKCSFPGHQGTWRSLVCNGERDIVECSRCGHQRTMRCNFDEEYA